MTSFNRPNIYYEGEFVNLKVCYHMSISWCLDPARSHSSSWRRCFPIEVVFHDCHVAFEPVLVKYKDLIDPYKDIKDTLQQSPNDCSIIYCHSRASCDELGSQLQRDGFKCLGEPRVLSHNKYAGVHLAVNLSALPTLHIALGLHATIPPSL